MKSIQCSDLTAMYTYIYRVLRCCAWVACELDETLTSDKVFQ